MALKKKQPTLHELHSDAHVRGDNALSVFHAVADDLSVAAAQHADVADRAQEEIDHLTALRDSAGVAANEAARQAEAVRSLVS